MSRLSCGGDAAAHVDGYRLDGYRLDGPSGCNVREWEPRRTDFKPAYRELLSEVVGWNRFRP